MSDSLALIRANAWRRFTNPTLAQQVTNLPPGAHLCLVYEDDPAEQLAALLPFIDEGLKAGERCVYVVDDQSMEALRLAMQNYGIDVQAESEQGRLVLWTRGEWRQPGQLDSSVKESQVRGVIEEALTAGFPGIRFCVEMTWTLGPPIPTDRLRHWEATINRIFTPELPGRIVCQYSRRRLSPDVIEAGLLTHPHAVLAGGVHNNSHYNADRILNEDWQPEPVNGSAVAEMLAGIGNPVAAT
jgi:hypothetical protein